MDGDTTFTKLFVGGLAWETQRDTMRCYFEQFGEIVEAVVIADKHNGRSKGYGFVTFRDPEAAMRALQDPTPVIDGRRANCNLAVIGAGRRVHPGVALPFGMVRLSTAMPSSSSSAAAAMVASYFPQPVHYTYPYYSYGYTGGYSHKNMYPMPMGFYGVYGGGGIQQQQAQLHSNYTAAGPAGGIQPYYPGQHMLTEGNQARTSYAGAAQYQQRLHHAYMQQAQYASQHPAAAAPANVSNEGTTTVATTGVGSSSSQISTERRPMF